MIIPLLRKKPLYIRISLGIIFLGFLIAGISILFLYSPNNTSNLQGNICINCDETTTGDGQGCYISSTEITPLSPTVPTDQEQLFLAEITTYGCDPLQKFVYYWNFGDGSSEEVSIRETSHMVTHTYETPGDYDVFVEVTSGGLSGEGGGSGGGGGLTDTNDPNNTNTFDDNEDTSNNTGSQDPDTSNDDTDPYNTSTP